MAEFAYHNNTNKNNEKKEEEEEKIESCAYITVGTGIGVGLVINSKPVHGLLHPEAGHISNTPDKWQFPPPTNTEKSKVDDNENIVYDHLEGTCPFHGSACVEGMASSVALAKRVNCTLEELKLLSDDDIIWEKCAHHLGGLCATLLLVASPEKIVLCMRKKIANAISIGSNVQISVDWNFCQRKFGKICAINKDLAQD